jgi:hypothetical protein
MTRPSKAFDFLADFLREAQEKSMGGLDLCGWSLAPQRHDKGGGEMTSAGRSFVWPTQIVSITMEHAHDP